MCPEEFERESSEKFFIALVSMTSDPFTGVLKWMRVWWNNSNPILICSYYLDVVEHTGYGPVLTQSDMGNENGNLARAHSFLRQWADRDLDNTLQHRWMAEKKNIPSEIVWSVFHAHFSFGYEEIFQFGIEQGWYDLKVPLEALIFRFLFIPWFQRELDLPNRVPLLIEQAPERFGAQDFKIAFIPESIQAARQIYAPPDHPAEVFMEELGHPEVTRECIWNVYLALLDKFHERHIVVLDEWHVVSMRAYEAEETNKNQGGPKEVVGQDQATIPDIPDLNSDDELGDADAEDVEADEEDAEISGEAPIIEMSI
ncbi:uncharacterized protein EV420DRAFT_1653801 [Desarmillaria tabescens]|uniref:Uncharacterized protein n=1 Tax=Armillaria tabescens TaxID=1929756 RepID=A0AA39J3S2_ARMTA|nr:uncharacterized protein EV420DRAFT_1653801 [Desarmillaria tabescens]KAK0434756.1 hypothetical protein EV420DRAFT_1653801 [Desarmillaria tabescens]